MLCESCDWRKGRIINASKGKYTNCAIYEKRIKLRTICPSHIKNMRIGDETPHEYFLRRIAINKFRLDIIAIILSGLALTISLLSLIL
jgi:hypothetical protein